MPSPPARPAHPAYPQKTFRIYRADDDRSPRRLATEVEAGVLREVSAQTQLIFQGAAVLKLVALSLRRSANPLDDDLDAPLSDDDVRFAEESLRGLPQIDLVEGLDEEARVVRSADPAPDAPVDLKPVRIDIRAERMYHLFTQRALWGEKDPRYRIPFIWAVWVLTHEVMHLVRERAFTEAWEKATPPRLQSANHAQKTRWIGPPPPSPTNSGLVPSRSQSLPTTPQKQRRLPPSASTSARPPPPSPNNPGLVPSKSQSLPTTPQKQRGVVQSASTSAPTTPTRPREKAKPLKGEAGHWMEEQLAWGCCLEPHDDLLPWKMRHPDVAVPEKLTLKSIIRIYGKKQVFADGKDRLNNGYDLWSLASLLPSDDGSASCCLLDPLIDAKTSDEMALGIAGLSRHLSTTPPTHFIKQAGVDVSTMKSMEAPWPKGDVFDAKSAACLKDVANILNWRLKPYPAGEDMDGLV